MAVEYLDYSGEMLDPLNAKLDMTAEDIKEDQRLQELYDYRDHADAYLVLIDGHKLRLMLSRDAELDGWLENYLSQQLQVIEHRRDHTGARPPMHLVITKWDLLDGHVVDGEPVTLGTVAGLITRQPTFAGHLASRRHDGDSAVRLIPVSVTGPFAALDECTGVVVKVPGQPVLPCNLDIPYVALLPDTLRWRMDQIVTDLRSPADDRAAERLRRNADRFVYAREVTVTSGAPVARWIARRVLKRRGGQAEALPAATAEMAQGLVDQLGAFFETRERLTRERLETLEKEHRDRRLAVATERDAFALALECFTAHLQAFEDKNPESVLTTGGHP
ncbi:hypothetical protein ACQP2X_25530 [Actinoplanes sp. CA-131856]